MEFIVGQIKLYFIVDEKSFVIKLNFQENMKVIECRLWALTFRIAYQSLLFY
jgi:hypothetical protein